MKSTMSLQIETEVLLRLISQLQIRGGAQALYQLFRCSLPLHFLNLNVRVAFKRFPLR
jgi:hypothetical protein